LFKDGSPEAAKKGWIMGEFQENASPVFPFLVYSKEERR